ncbi:bifunctional diaminohydroxyphosphoribosylaminopyrimidine deaminase/5-amino-6-(5-phosphoribosylamino)uracil reductase RibD [Secundilactobacillus paracollinoides]|uniref:bifunctional diaminohydroxyphosphoribosylaminopyrimidine deaminase/5-amino-6-(5-phosphoribosylamino)uracil reductase RibD n=1 Tax=Secundilactobacillus paracollinoides TaxID=240427 RepID=UPI00192D15DA|nr:bifunctional diaminohydroxyphosphoribosylaminopyrimidine deaminase/5-amino-6-(5-phosphoribosylamino)uracil reductase RibD [Secundilactobacillus paracollinoides]
MNDQQLMAKAIAAARNGITHTWTNPVVGAVIVKNNQLLATGYHHRFGDMHAEINALSHLQDINDARGATMYVTLEPCSHYGKTPPCAKRLVEVGIKRVVIGQQDPNPLVSGHGIAILKAAGIAVTVLNKTADLNVAYTFFYQHHRPLVTLKYATSMDGKLNDGSKTRTLLTGKPAYHDSQTLRLHQQAILIGETTLTVDDPQLTVRDTTPDFPPIRIILVNNAADLNRNATVFQSDAPLWILCRQSTEQQKWPDFVSVFTDPTRAPQTIMQLLYEQGVQSLLIEGGAHTQAAFSTAGLVDRLVVYVAPLILGGSDLPAIWGTGCKQPLPFDLTATTQLGNDTRFDLRRQ